MSRVAKVKFTRDHLKLLLDGKDVTINLPPDCGQVVLSSPIDNMAERILREQDRRRSDKMAEFIDVLFKEGLL